MPAAAHAARPSSATWRASSIAASAPASSNASATTGYRSRCTLSGASGSTPDTRLRHISSATNGMTGAMQRTAVTSAYHSVW